MSEQTKSWWASKTVWGGVIALVAGVAGAFGIALTEAVQADLAEYVVALASGVGGLVAIYGRIKASSKLK